VDGLVDSRMITQPDDDDRAGGGVAAPTARPAFDLRRDLGVPILLFLATRVAQLLVLAWMKPPGSRIDDKLLSWDSGWFIDVAQQGYPHGYTLDGSGAVTANGLAFFPLYPWLIRVFASIGFSYGYAALIVTALSGIAGSVLIFLLARALAADGRLGERARGSARTIGYALVVLVFAQPMSIVFSMGYTEALFIALVAGALLAAYRRAWVITGVLGVAAGLTRPTGAALAVALAVAVILRLMSPDVSVRERITASIAGIAALASVPAYILWVGHRVGDVRAWFNIQTAGWGSTFDYGHSTWQFVTSTLHTGDGWVAMAVVAILIAASVALLVSLFGRGWLPLQVYGVIAFILVVGQSGFYHSKPRLLVPVLLLFVPAALAAGRTTPRRAAAWLSAYALFGLWFGAYMITVWQYAI
jgi:Mannosyltransferase (PIG-V)